MIDDGGGGGGGDDDDGDGDDGAGRCPWMTGEPRSWMPSPRATPR